MTTFDRVKKLAEEQKITIVELEEKLGFGRNSLYSWKKKTPNGDSLQRVADFFNVSTDYLLGRTEKKYWELNEKDNRDIKDDLDNLLNSLDSKNALAFNGEPLDDETRELLAISLERSMRFAKEEAKRKYTPKKYRDEEDQD